MLKMRLRPVPYIDTILGAQDPLLPLPRLGWLAPSRRRRLRQPAHPPGPARPSGLARGDQTDRGSGTDWRGTRSAARSGPRRRTNKATPREPRTRTRPAHQEHRPAGYGLSGRTLVAGGVAPSDARAACPRSGNPGGAAGDPRSGRRPLVVPAPGGNAIGLLGAAEGNGREPRHHRAAKDRSARGQGSAGG